MARDAGFSKTCLLQPVEFFSVKFVEFRIDILDGILCSGDDDVLYGVDCIALVKITMRWFHFLAGQRTSPVDNFDDLVKNYEGSLEAGQFH